jgi:hypothetical protein
MKLRPPQSANRLVMRLKMTSPDATAARKIFSSPSRDTVTTFTSATRRRLHNGGCKRKRDGQARVLIMTTGAAREEKIFGLQCRQCAFVLHFIFGTGFMNYDFFESWHPVTVLKHTQHN